MSSVTPPPEEKRLGPGPYRRKAESVGDVLLRVLMGKGRVASLSIKDRAAILMAALRANFCYWFDTRTGNFTTSAYYRPDPHAWVTKFNKTRPADHWLGKNWERFDAKLDYRKFSGPDDFLSEGSGYGQGQSFPHPFKLGEFKDEKGNIDEKKNKESYYYAVLNSPQGNELLWDFAKAAIVQEKLGQGGTTDLLCVSFSSNDLVGHTWGPDSQEVLDVTLCSDAIMKELLDFLDEKVGKENYYIAMIADHGVCPLPEFAKLQGKASGRVDPDLLTTGAEEFLTKKFLLAAKNVPWLDQPKKSNAWVYLNRGTLKELNLSQERVERALADWLRRNPASRRLSRATELTRDAGKEKPSDLFMSVKRSFHRDGCGDVIVILKPYHLFSPPTFSKKLDKLTMYRTSHGTPHPYDTHVPLLVMGPRIEPGVRKDRITPQAMASILAECLACRPPAARSIRCRRDCSRSNYIRLESLTYRYRPRSFAMMGDPAFPGDAVATTTLPMEREETKTAPILALQCHSGKRRSSFHGVCAERFAKRSATTSRSATKLDDVGPHQWTSRRLDRHQGSRRVENGADVELSRDPGQRPKTRPARCVHRTLRPVEIWRAGSVSDRSYGALRSLTLPARHIWRFHHGH